MRITANFESAEFDCHDGSPYPLYANDDDIANPIDARRNIWLFTRLEPLCQTLEVIREAIGGAPIHIDSGYRTIAYDERLYEASAKDGTAAPASRSQHPKGRAADIVTGAMSPAGLYALILQLYADGKLPSLGGVGIYPHFVHIDVRPRPDDGHLAQWSGVRRSNGDA